MLMGWGLAAVQRAGPALWCTPTCGRLRDSAACSGAGDFQRSGPVAYAAARPCTPGPRSVLTHDLPAGPCCPRSAQGQRAGAGLCGLQHLHCAGGSHAVCASCFAAAGVGQYEWGRAMCFAARVGRPVRGAAGPAAGPTLARIVFQPSLPPGTLPLPTNTYFHTPPHTCTRTHAQTPTH